MDDSWFNYSINILYILSLLDKNLMVKVKRSNWTKRKILWYQWKLLHDNRDYSVLSNTVIIHRDYEDFIL